MILLSLNSIVQAWCNLSPCQNNTVDNLHSSQFYLRHNPAQKYRQIHINAFKSSFHRKCKADLAVHVLNLPGSYPAQRITVIYREAHSLSLCPCVPPTKVSILKAFLLVLPSGYLVKSRGICISGTGLSTRSVIYG